MRLTLLAVGLLMTSSAHAATRTLTHQVRLVDALGAPVEGTQTVRIRLWNDASAGAVDTDEEWVSDPIPATFSAGYATVRFTVDDTELIGDRWLSVSIGANHLDGRTPITDVPSAPSRPSIIASGSTRTWSDGRVATSCLEYRYPEHGRQYAGVTGDGVYRVDPTGGNPADAVDLYCDMTTDGGGWTLIGKSGRSGYGGLSTQQYVNLIANPTSHVNVELLAHTTPPTPGVQAWLDRPVTDAIWDRSPHQIVRVDISGGTTNDGRYYQRRDGELRGGGLWTAIRDSRLWSNGTTTDYLTGLGQEVFLGQTTYDATSNTFPNGTDGTMGWWDVGVLTLNDGSTLEVTRHMGLLCDGVGNRGGQWLLTSNPNNGGFRVESSITNAVIWVK